MEHSRGLIRSIDRMGVSVSAESDTKGLILKAAKAAPLDTGYAGLSTRKIAEAAGVRYLIPFHFSRRYEHQPSRIYDEVRAGCARAELPPTG